MLHSGRRSIPEIFRLIPLITPSYMASAKSFEYPRAVRLWSGTLTESAFFHASRLFISARSAYFAKAPNPSRKTNS